MTEPIEPSESTLHETPELPPAESTAPIPAPAEAQSAESLPTPDLTATASFGYVIPPSPAPKLSALHIKAAALTDVGNLRKNNEDSFGYVEEDGIYVVCDGMGGMASGEVASASAVATLLSTFAASRQSAAPVSARLLQAIQHANHVVHQAGQAADHKGMGTTLVAAAVDQGKLLIANVGDSRAYMVYAGVATQLTVDHSYVNELIRNGTITLENAHQAELKGMESVITRAIGAAPEVAPDFFSIEPRAGALILLTSDGLTRYLQPNELATILTQAPFEAVCPTLIQLAKQRGGQDNVTCLLLHVS